MAARSICAGCSEKTKSAIGTSSMRVSAAGTLCWPGRPPLATRPATGRTKVSWFGVSRIGAGMTDLVGHFLLFAVLGVVFLLLPLVIGLFVRPTNPTAQKLAAYECGEPTIGSSYIQFDLRFYVVALLFIIFDVEVAFFFPWAAIFGGATQLLDARLSNEARVQLSERLLNRPAGSLGAENVISVETARGLALTGLVDILV